MKAIGRIFVSGLKGQAYATVECEENGSIHPAFAEAVLAHALNIYNEMPSPYRVVAFGKDDFVFNEDELKHGG